MILETIRNVRTIFSPGLFEGKTFGLSGPNVFPLVMRSVLLQALHHIPHSPIQQDNLQM